ncbi:MAG: RNA polymerase subunit sigma-70, partial [Cyanobium sp. PLM2.Bin73]
MAPRAAAAPAALAPATVSAATVSAATVSAGSRAAASGPRVAQAEANQPGGGDLVRSYLRDIGRVPLLS